MSAPVLGQGIVRKDGRLKVTGGASYAADNRLPGMVYATLVGSTVPAGRIRRIDTESAFKFPGVLAIVTHENAPRLHPPGSMATGGEYAEHFFPLQDPEIFFWGQYVAVVVADTLERAEEAAARLRVDYDSARFDIDMERDPAQVYDPSRTNVIQKLQLERGDFAAGLEQADVVLRETYRTPQFTHNAMEPHATVAHWTDGKLTIYEPTQWVMGLRSVVSKSFDLKPEAVRIISPFVGGGFGSKGFAWPHTLAAAMASRQTRRPVKLVLSRAQMFASVGHRGPTRQAIVLAAKQDGRLTAIEHATLTTSSMKGGYVESCGLASAMLYACPNLKVSHRAARLNTGTPCPTRAPGEAPGLFALESAMDELAVKLGLDPIELRLRNYAEEDPDKKKPWSSKHLRECYQRGAELFGWNRRQAAPGSMQEKGELIGWGMATATYPANKREGAAAVRIYADGRVLVRSATQDIGTGTYTTLAQVAADELQVPIEKVSCEIGDSTLPPSGVSGGSSTSASVAPIVQAAARALKEKLEKFASAAEAVRQSGREYLEGEASHGSLATMASALFPGGASNHSFGAHFAEVRVNPATRQIRVSRVVAVMDGGKILNSLTARSQIQGGIVWGIGMTLLERAEFDPHSGAPVVRNLADYLVPVNADVPDITVEFTDHPDLQFNSLGVRGIGEIGITGITGAIANAVFHATGVRVRDLPITLDKILV